MRRRLLAAILLATIAMTTLSGQQLPPQEPLTPEEYSPEEFPVWTRDLRRFEVIAVGSFPITFFLTSLIYDFSYYAANDFSPTYSMGTQRGKEDIAIIMGSAAAASLVLAATDLIINVSKRNRAREDGNELRGVPDPSP